MTTEPRIERLFPDDEAPPYSKGGYIPGGPVQVTLDDAECILAGGGCVRRDRRHLDAAHGGRAEA